MRTEQEMENQLWTISEWGRHFLVGSGYNTKWQKFISYTHLEVGKSKIKALADSVSGEGLLSHSDF